MTEAPGWGRDLPEVASSAKVTLGRSLLLASVALASLLSLAGAAKYINYLFQQIDG